MNQILEICHCGNDRASHHKGKFNCLALACECTGYVDRWDPKPKPETKAPAGWIGNSGWAGWADPARRRRVP